MAKQQQQDTIEGYYVAAVFPLDPDLEVTRVKGKNMTAREAALSGAIKLSGFLNLEDSGYTIEKHPNVKDQNGWKRFEVRTRYGDAIQVAVAHASTKLA